MWQGHVVLSGARLGKHFPLPEAADALTPVFPSPSMFFLQLGFERILPGSGPAFLPLISTEAKKLKTGSGPHWALFPSPCPLSGAPDPGLQRSRCASPAPRGEEEEEEKEEAKFGGQMLPSALPTRPRFRTGSSPSPRVNNTQRKGKEAARAGFNPPSAFPASPRDEK